MFTEKYSLDSAGDGEFDGCVLLTHDVISLIWFEFVGNESPAPQKISGWRARDRGRSTYGADLK